MESLKITLFALFCLIVNIPLGRWRGKYKRFSMPWIAIVHASVPVIIALRLWFDVNNFFIPLFIALAVLGQYLGNKTVKIHDKR